MVSTLYASFTHAGGVCPTCQGNVLASDGEPPKCYQCGRIPVQGQVPNLSLPRKRSKRSKEMPDAKRLERPGA